MHIYGGRPASRPAEAQQPCLLELAAGRKSGSMNQPALSVQLYAVNDRLTDDLDGTLARLSRMGLRHVEAFNFVTRPAGLAEAFARHGLAAKTGSPARRERSSCLIRTRSPVR
jgi:hypothetical protein